MKLGKFTFGKNFYLEQRCSSVVKKQIYLSRIFFPNLWMRGDDIIA